MSDEEVEIIHSSQFQMEKKSKAEPNDISDILVANQKLQHDNDSLRQETLQYKELLQKSIESLNQFAKDSSNLRIQLSQKDSQIANYQNAMQVQSNEKQIDSIKAMKESYSNRDSFGNKLTNISSLDCDYNKFSQISSSQTPQNECFCDRFVSQKSLICESIKKLSSVIKETGNNYQQSEILKSLYEFEDSLKVFIGFHEQMTIQKCKTDPQQKQPELIQTEQNLQKTSSDHFHSVEEENENQSPFHNDDLDTSQFEGEIHIQLQFELFEQSFHKLTEQEKQMWKEKLLKLSNSI